MAYAIYSGGLLTKGADSYGRFTMAGAQAEASANITGARTISDTRITAAREVAAAKRFREQQAVEASRYADALREREQERAFREKQFGASAAAANRQQQHKESYDHASLQEKKLDRALREKALDTNVAAGKQQMASDAAHKAAVLDERQMDRDATRQNMLDELLLKKDKHGNPLVSAADVRALNSVSDLADATKIRDSAARTAAHYSTTGPNRDIIRNALRLRDKTTSSMQAGASADIVQRDMEQEKQYRNAHPDVFGRIDDDAVSLRGAPESSSLAESLYRLTDAGTQAEYKNVDPVLAGANTPGAVAFFQAAGYSPDQSRDMVTSNAGPVRHERDAVMTRAAQIQQDGARARAAAFNAARNAADADMLMQARDMKVPSMVEAVDAARQEFGDLVAPVREAFNDVFSEHDLPGATGLADYGANALKGMDPGAVRTLIESALAGAADNPNSARIKVKRVVDAIAPGGRPAAEAYSTLIKGETLSSIQGYRGAEYAAKAVVEFVQAPTGGYADAMESATALAADPGILAEYGEAAVHDFAAETAFAEHRKVSAANINPGLRNALLTQGRLVLAGTNEDSVIDYSDGLKAVADGLHDSDNSRTRNRARAILDIESGATVASKEDLFVAHLGNDALSERGLYVESIKPFYDLHKGSFTPEQEAGFKKLQTSAHAIAGEPSYIADKTPELGALRGVGGADPGLRNMLSAVTGRAPETLDKEAAALVQSVERANDVADEIVGALYKVAPRGTTFAESTLVDFSKSASVELVPGAEKLKVSQMLSLPQLRELGALKRKFEQRRDDSGGPSNIPGVSPGGRLFDYKEALRAKVREMVSNERVLSSGLYELGDDAKLKARTGASLVDVLDQRPSNPQSYEGNMYDLGTREGFTGMFRALVGVDEASVNSARARVERFRNDFAVFTEYKNGQADDVIEAAESTGRVRVLSHTDAANRLRHVSKLTGEPEFETMAGALQNPAAAAKVAREREMGELELLTARHELSRARKEWELYQQMEALKQEKIAAEAKATRDENERDQEEHELGLGE